jgi:two-component system KDP operon response regulator KdpE
MSEGTRVLVVDDDPPIRRLLRTTLGAQGFAVLEAVDAESALHSVRTDRPDVVLLDLGLPDLDGLHVVRQMRSSKNDTPIIILSSRGDERVKVAALDLGADDYVTKPFGMAELVARIRTALRHRIQEQGGEPIIVRNGLTIDLSRRRVIRNGDVIRLSPKEYDILRLLAVHAGRVLTHRMIMQEVWNAAGDVQYLRIYIRQLRQKLERDPARPQLIVTETGVGYRFAD